MHSLHPSRIAGMSYPANYKYTKEHEWIEVNGNIGTVGITDYAQSSLGDIVFVDLPKIGAALAAHDTFGSVESVKAVSDLYSPVAGTVTEVNSDLNDTPEKINEDANGTWLMKVEISDTSALNDLLDAEAYEKYVAEETGH